MTKAEIEARVNQKNIRALRQEVERFRLALEEMIKDKRQMQDKIATLSRELNQMRQQVIVLSATNRGSGPTSA